MQHAASHTTTVQPSSHNQRHVLIGKQWHQLPELIPTNSNSGLLQHSARKQGGLILQRPRAHMGPEKSDIQQTNLQEDSVCLYSAHKSQSVSLWQRCPISNSPAASRRYVLITIIYHLVHISGTWSLESEQQQPTNHRFTAIIQVKLC